MDARRKRLRYRAGRAAGPPTPPGYGISIHLPTPKLLVNANFLAKTYLRRIREHRNKVKKTRARTHKSPIGHSVNIH